MTTKNLLRLRERMLSALNPISVPQAADLRAELTDSTEIELRTVQEVSGLVGVPASHFFEENAA